MKRRLEERELTILLYIVVACVVSSLVFMLIKNGKSQDNTEQVEQSEQKPYSNRDSKQAYQSEETAETQGSPLHTVEVFDPNTADSATLVEVGLTPFQARNIIKYRRKGGEYHRPEDMRSVYELTVRQWESIAPKIRIQKDYQYLADVEDVSRTYPSYPRHSNPTSTAYDSVEKQHTQTKEDNSPFASLKRKPKLRNNEKVDLSLADTTILKMIPGIGSYYARKIVEYGERLGGFVSISQLNDVGLDFLPAAIEEYITLSTPHIKQLRINHLSTRELNRHPYLNYAQAKQIAERVRLYGPITSWEQLLFLSDFNERDKLRLEPYVSFE